jgi:RNA recognition motif-containing protein
LAWATTDEDLKQHFESVGTVNSAVVIKKTRGGKTLSMGCGVVEFSSPEEANNALNNLNETELGGRTIKVREDRSVDVDNFVPKETAVVDTAVEETVVVETPQVVAATPPTKTKKKRSPKPKAKKVEEEVTTTVATTTRVKRERALNPKKIYIHQLSWETTADDLIEFFSPIGGVLNAEVMLGRNGRSLGHGVVEFSDADYALEAIDRFHKLKLGGRSVSVKEYYELV